MEVTFDLGAYTRRSTEAVVAMLGNRHAPPILHQSNPERTYICQLKAGHVTLSRTKKAGNGDLKSNNCEKATMQDVISCYRKQ